MNSFEEKKAKCQKGRGKEGPLSFAESVKSLDPALILCEYRMSVATAV